MVQRKVIVRGATNQALDELDATDIPDLSAAYEAAGGIATHSADTTVVHGIVDTSALSLTSHDHDADYEAAGGIATHLADTTAVHGITDTAALSLDTHDHDADYEAAGGIATHAGLADPHTGYRLESADHSHASTGLQAGTVAHTALTAVGANDHHAQTHATAHQPGGADAMAVDAAAATGSLRTLGTGAAQAAAGGHTHAGANPWTAVIKTADESKNSLATVADDALLVATLLANTSYVLKLRTFFLTVTAADLKYRLVFTGTTTRVRRRIFRTATTDIAQTIELKTAFDVADVVLCTTGLNPWFEEDVILQVGASGGVFKLQWAQVTSNAGPTTCLEGSYLEYAVT